MLASLADLIIQLMRGGGASRFLVPEKSIFGENPPPPPYDNTNIVDKQFTDSLSLLMFVHLINLF